MLLLLPMFYLGMWVLQKQNLIFKEGKDSYRDKRKITGFHMKKMKKVVIEAFSFVVDFLPTSVA